MHTIMKPTLLISHKVIAEFSSRINDILGAAPKPLELLPFTPDVQLTPAQMDNIEAVYYSRDIWEGTEKSALSPAAQSFWNLIDRTRNVKWIAVYSAGTDQKRYQDCMRRGMRLTTGAGAQADAVGLACWHWHAACPIGWARNSGASGRRCAARTCRRTFPARPQ